MTSDAAAKAKGRNVQDLTQKASAVAEKLQALAKPIFGLICLLIPYMIKYGRAARGLWQKLPQNAINFVLGFIFCFFGGLYPVVFAAIQAAEYGGRKQVMEAVTDLANEAMVIIEESKKDDKRDDDKDGIADVNQIESKEYVQRKTLLVLKKMNPAKVDTAIGNIYQVWLAVAAVLTIEFARAISLALAMADFIKQPVNRYISPAVKAVVPDEYDKWVPIILGWICKAIGVSIAWWVQAVRSAFASALTGGLMMSRAAYQALKERDIDLGGLIKGNHEDTMVDEYLSYVFAAMGFFFQFAMGFDMPFPFSLLLWPFEVAEVMIRFSVTSAGISK